MHKQHYLSLADVPYSSYEEMLSLKTHIESVLAECLGLDCVTFEHGTSNPLSKGANSVDHVHIHIVPFERPIWQDIVSTISPLSIKAIDNYERLYQEWQSMHPDSYLLFQDTNQKIYYIPDASNSLTSSHAVDESALRYGSTIKSLSLSAIQLNSTAMV